MKLADIIAVAGWSQSITARKRQPMLYDPDYSIREHVNAAGAALHGHFESEDKSRRPIRKALRNLIEDARMLGFQDGAEYSGKKLTDKYAAKVAKQSKRQSRELATQIAKTTRKGLKNDSAYITTSDRAITIAKHEGRKAYNKGLLEAMGGNGFGKTWVASGDNPCDDCAENEDDDIIDMDDVFTSGDSTPPAHPNCGCSLGVHT